MAKDLAYGPDSTDLSTESDYYTFKINEMKTITEKDYELLKTEIYTVLMATSMTDSEGNEIEMDMGDMGNCDDAAQEIINTWMNKAEIVLLYE